MRKLWRVKCAWCDQLIVGDWKDDLFKARRHTKKIRPGFRYTHNQMVCIGSKKVYQKGHPELVAPDAT